MAKSEGEEKQKAPKPVCQVTLTIYDSGDVVGDFYVWEKNEVGKRKKWTVGGVDFMQFLHRMQPNNVPVIASCMNVQIVNAGLPYASQGPWIRRREDGTVAIDATPGNHRALSLDQVPDDQGPASPGRGVQAAQAIEDEAANEIEND